MRAAAIFRAFRPDACEFADAAIPIFIACFPLAWLALDKAFYTDWNNHLWIIGYMGEYFRQHFAFPLVLNTDQRIGITYPLFYGTLFYPIAGIISAFAGAGVALRLLLFGVFWIQSSQITKLIRIVFPDRYAGWCVAAVVSFGVYPLTNLYNRSAIPEFVAASLLVSACSLWLRAIYTGLRRAWLPASLAWLLFTLSAGTHPITGAIGGVFWGALVVGSLLATSDRPFGVKMAAAHLLMSLVVLSPWLYVTLKFYKHLLVSTLPPQVVVFADTIDLAWGRILPIPFDIRPLAPVSLSSISTPYLEAQVNFGLLIIVCFLGLYSYKRLRTGNLSINGGIGAAAICLGLFPLVLYCSISTRVWHAAPAFLGMIQFAYRLVTYCDLLLYLAIVLLLSALGKLHVEIRNKLQICLVAALSLMGQSVLIKFTHAASIQNTRLAPGTGLFENRETLRQLPGQFYGLDGYVSRDGFAPNLDGIPTIRLRVKGDHDFGAPESALVGSPGWFSTNVQAFPWNRLVINGKVLARGATHVSSDGILSPEEFPIMTRFTFSEDTLAAHADSAPTRVEYRFVPHRSYMALRLISGTILLGWASLLLTGAFFMSWFGVTRSSLVLSTRVKIPQIVFVAILKRFAYWGTTFVFIGTLASILQAVARLNVLPSSPPQVSTSAEGPSTLVASMRVKFLRNLQWKGRKPEPLLVTGGAGAADTMSIEYVTPDSVRLRIDHGTITSAKSRVIRINSHDTYLVEVVETEDDIILKLNGREEVRLNSTPYPTAREEISFGRNKVTRDITAENFSGQLLSSTVNRLVDHPPSMMATLEIEFPQNRHVNPLGDPLVVTGVPGAGDLVSVRYEGGDRVRFQIDHWGAPSALSNFLDVPRSKVYVLDVEAGEGGIVVNLNNREVDRFEGKAFPTTRAQVTLGENRIGGGTTTKAFSGKILTNRVYLEIDKRNVSPK